MVNFFPDFVKCAPNATLSDVAGELVVVLHYFSGEHIRLRIMRGSIPGSGQYFFIKTFSAMARNLEISDVSPPSASKNTLRTLSDRFGAGNRKCKCIYDYMSRVDGKFRKRLTAAVAGQSEGSY